MKKLTFIGLGNMGFPMASNLLKTFSSLTVYNRSQEKCQILATQGAHIASSIEEIAQKSDLIFLALPGPIEVEPIVRKLIDYGHKDQIIVDFSTIAVQLSQDLAAFAKDKGLVYLDVPVSGGGLGASKAELSLMIGATQAEINHLGLLPYFNAVGKTFHYMGQRGLGTAIKLINNAMAFSIQVINAEALAMADALQIPTELFYQVVSSSSGNNAILGVKKNKVLTQDLEANFTLDLSIKDLELARQLCQTSKISNFSLNLALQMYRLSSQKGYGSKDTVSVIKVIRELGQHDKEI